MLSGTPFTAALALASPAVPFSPFHLQQRLLVERSFFVGFLSSSFKFSQL